MPTCLPTPPFCASVSLLAPTLMAQQGVWKGLVYFLGGSSYPKCGGLALNPLPTLYGQGHKAGGGSRASRGRRSCQDQCLPGRVSSGYSSTTFSMLRCRLQPPSPANPSPGWRGGLALGPAFSSAQQEQCFVCLQGTHPPQAAVLGCFHSGALSWRELCYTRPLHRCIAPGQIWDSALHFSDCRLKSFLFPFLPPTPFPLVLVKDTGNWFRA